MATAVAAPVVPAQPRPLLHLVASEACERFAFFGMQSLLVLYLSGWLLLPQNAAKVLGLATLRASLSGPTPLSPTAFASILFGIYAGGVYLTPLLGGLIGDHLLGRTRTIILGAALMTAGHFLMAFEASFLIAITCLLAGVGCFKGNIAVQVAELYPPEDARRTRAFQLFFIGVNGAAIVAPLVCGTLGQKLAWHWGFAAAGVSMLVGLAVYLAGRPKISTAQAKRGKAAPFVRSDLRGVALLIGLLPILAMGAVATLQVFNAYLLWASANYDLDLFGWTMPVSWLVSLEAIMSLACLALSLAFWRWWSIRRTEPDDLAKLAGGTLITALAPLLLVAASLVTHATGRKLGLGWALAFHFLNDIGYANVLPIGLALFTRLAPRSVQGLGASLFFVSLFLGNLLVGWLGAYSESLAAPVFWLIHAGIVFASGAILLILRAVGPGLRA